MAESDDDEGASHYEVLNVPPSFSLEEIRASVHVLEQRYSPCIPTKWDVDRNRCPPMMLLAIFECKRLGVPCVMQSLRQFMITVYEQDGNSTGMLCSARNCVGGYGRRDMNETGKLEYQYPCRCRDYFFVAARELHEAGLGFVDKNSGESQRNWLGHATAVDGAALWILFFAFAGSLLDALPLKNFYGAKFWDEYSSRDITPQNVNFWYILS